MAEKELPTLRGDDRQRAEEIRAKYWGDKIDPDAALMELATIFRLASGESDDAMLSEWAFAYLEVER